MASPRILVCGGRDFKDKDLVYRVLDEICDTRGWKTPEDEFGNYLPSVIVIQGGARGADSYADMWAVINWCEQREFPADWDKYGKKAGYIRNQQMLDEGKPNLVVAFPGGKGTRMMIELARKAGVEVIAVD